MTNFSIERVRHAVARVAAMDKSSCAVLISLFRLQKENSIELRFKDLFGESEKTHGGSRITRSSLSITTNQSENYELITLRPH